MEFRDRLKEERKKRGVSQSELARAIFVSRSAVAKWENGIGTPGESSYEALLNYFGLTREQLPLIKEVEAVAVPKNKRIKNLSLISILLSLCLVALIGIAVITHLVPPDHKYDWDRVDALVDEIGVDNLIYLPSGSPALRSRFLEIYYNKDADGETFVRLEKIYQDSEDYYQLFFEKHYYNLVEDKILSLRYSCSFHYEDIIYNTELVSVCYYEGDSESVDGRVPYASYQVLEKDFSKGEFVSCRLEEIPVIGIAPDGELLHIDLTSLTLELMRFGFDSTADFFSRHDLAIPY